MHHESDIVNPPLLPNQAGLRRCLKCGKEFRSRNAGHRICRECNRINSVLGPIPERLLALQRGAKRQNGIPLGVPNSYETSFS